MKALNLPSLPDPLPDTLVVPVAEPLWVMRACWTPSDGDWDPPVPYTGQVALSVPCSVCGGAGYFGSVGPNPCSCTTCHGLGRLIAASALVEFARPELACVLFGVVPPGEWAAVLTNVQPTTTRCPHDCQRFGGKVPGRARGSNWDWVPCWCNGTNSLAPIPHDGSDEWQP